MLRADDRNLYRDILWIGMFVLNHQQNEELVIGGDIRVRVVRIRGNDVSLEIDAPSDVPIVRSEILDQSAVRPTGEIAPKTRRSQSDRPISENP